MFPQASPQMFRGTKGLQMVKMDSFGQECPDKMGIRSFSINFSHPLFPLAVSWHTSYASARAGAREVSIVLPQCQSQKQMDVHAK